MSTDFPVYPQAMVLPLLAAVALVLEIPPLIWHVRSHNLAASSLMLWIITSNVMNFINPLIWPTDNIAAWWHGQGLCDVEVKIMVASWIGVIGSLLCILRNLAAVLKTDKAVICLSKAERQRKFGMELFLCIGLPIWMMVAHYIVQPNRYYIFAISGCTVSVDNSWPKFVLLFIWPLLFSVGVVYYCALIMIRMHRYRRDLSTILSTSSSDLTKQRFLRLFVMAATLITAILPVQIYILYENSTVPLLPYSWSLVHGTRNWNQEILYPTYGAVIFDRWIQVSFGILMFFFFGFGKDARDMYRRWLITLGLGHLFPSLGRTSRANSTSSRSRLLPKAQYFFSRSLRPSFMQRPEATLSPPLHKHEPFSIFSPSPERNLTFESKTLTTFSSSPICTEKTANHILQSQECTIPGASYVFDTPRDPFALPAASDAPDKIRTTNSSTINPPTTDASHSFFARFLISANRSAPARRLGGMGIWGRQPRPGFGDIGHASPDSSSRGNSRSEAETFV